MMSFVTSTDRLRCSRAQSQLGSAGLPAATDGVLKRLAEHLATCLACRTFSGVAALWDAALRRGPVWEPGAPLANQAPLGGQALLANQGPHGDPGTPRAACETLRHAADMSLVMQLLRSRVVALATDASPRAVAAATVTQGQCRLVWGVGAVRWRTPVGRPMPGAELQAPAALCRALAAEAMAAGPIRDAYTFVSAPSPGAVVERVTAAELDFEETMLAVLTQQDGWDERLAEAYGPHGLRDRLELLQLYLLDLQLPLARAG